jgi:hypothetical protein
MTTIESLPNGARFHRADLHIHSFGGSHDVKDRAMIPEAIVKAAVAEKLDLIAITDHNEIRNVELALTAAAKHSLAVIPAVELSTPDGHLLCYVPTHDALLKFFGRITVVDRDSPNSRCQNSILDCLNHLNDLGGFGILAHVDIESGFEIENPGNSPHKIDVLCHKALLGVELKTSTSNISYSEVDPDVNRVNNGKERIKRLGLGAKQYLARVLNSDSHSLHALGKNAQGDRKVTRIKMDRPSFEALRIALEDSDARIRIEDHVPLAVPHVIGIRLDGGFLDGQAIRFNPNLNCIIGGRGTGKSTTFEAVRCLTGESSNSPLVDCEVWPSELSLFWRDQAGQVHSLCRPLGGILSNLKDPVNGPIAFSVDCYGQGETAQISKQAQGNPVALISYLDRFVDTAEASTAENSARDELLNLQEEIEKASQNVGLIPQYERALATTQQQLAALEQANAKDVIELQRKLATEREIRAQINTKITQVEHGLDSFSAKSMVEEIVALGDPTPFTVGADEFDKILAGCRSFETEVASARSQAKVSFQKLQKTAEIQLTSWKVKEAEALKTIEVKRKTLEAQNIRLDMAYIQKLSKDEAKFKADLATLRTWKPHLQELQRKRLAASKNDGTLVNESQFCEMLLEGQQRTRSG